MPVIPKYPGLHTESAPRWAALSAKARFGDPDLVVPAGERKRYEASFERFASVFPDDFYVSERGRYFPDDSEDKGRLLSAGYHSVLGFYRDDQPLMELILDDKGQRELNRLWEEFEFISRIHGAHIYSIFLQSERRGFWQRSRVRLAASRGSRDHRHSCHHGPAGRLSRQGPGRPDEGHRSARSRIASYADPNVKNNPIAPERAFNGIDAPAGRSRRCTRQPSPNTSTPCLNSPREPIAGRYRKAERDDILAYYHTLREKNDLTHEEAVRNSIVSILMSPDFCYRIDLDPHSRWRRQAFRSLANPSRPRPCRRAALRRTRWRAG